jgi:signal transduction histidine kinase
MKRYIGLALLLLVSLAAYSQSNKGIFRDTVLYQIPKEFGTKPHYLFGFPFGYEYLYKSKCYNIWDKRLEELTIIIQNNDTVEKQLVLEIINPFIKTTDISVNPVLKPLKGQLNDCKQFSVKPNETIRICFSIEKGFSREGYKFFLWDSYTFTQQGKSNTVVLSIIYFSFILIAGLILCYILFFGSEKKIFGWYISFLLMFLTATSFQIGIFRPFIKDISFFDFSGESFTGILYWFCVYFAARFYPNFYHKGIAKIFSFFSKKLLPVAIFLGIIGFVFNSFHGMYYIYVALLAGSTAFAELAIQVLFIYYWKDINKNQLTKLFCIICSFRFTVDFFCNLRYIGLFPIPKEWHDYYLFMPNSFHTEVFQFIAIFFEIVYVFFMLIYQTWYIERAEALMKIAKEKENNYLNFINGIEKERQRISDELHNSFQLNLSFLRDKILDFKKKVEQDTSKGETEFQNIITEIVKAQDDLKKLVEDLDTKEIEKYGLLTALQSMQGRSKTTTFKIVLNSNSDCQDISLPNQIHIYRMIQIALHNTLKCANASCCYIQLLMDEKQLNISIEDDGQGFEVQNVKKGFGLRNIEDRTNMLGGTLVIESSENKGTILFIQLPISSLLSFP